MARLPGGALGRVQGQVGGTRRFDLRHLRSWDHRAAHRHRSIRISVRHLGVDGDTVTDSELDAFAIEQIEVAHLVVVGLQALRQGDVTADEHWCRVRCGDRELDLEQPPLVGVARLMELLVHQEQCHQPATGGLAAATAHDDVGLVGIGDQRGLQFAVDQWQVDRAAGRMPLPEAAG